MKFKSTLLSLFAITTIAVAQVPTNGLIAYYPFNGNTTDESSNSYDGTTHGAPTLVADRAGNANSAYDFNGTSDYIEIPDNATLNPANITIAAWIKPEVSVSHTPDIIRKSTYSNASNEEYVLRLGSDVNADFEVKINASCNAGGTWAANTYTAAVSLSTWSLLVGTYDSTSIKLYVNGSLVKTVTTAQSAINDCAGGTLRIGTAWNNYPNYYKGTIDDIRLYNRAISAAEVTALYNEDITGINTITNNNNIKIYPNPANNQIVIDNGNSASLNGCTVKIVNMLGQTVYTSAINQQQLTVNLSSLNGSGIYFVHITDLQNKTISIQKIVKQ